MHALLLRAAFDRRIRMSSEAWTLDPGRLEREDTVVIFVAALLAPLAGLLVAESGHRLSGAAS